MAAFVPEMPQQSTVGLTKMLSDPLAFNRVRLDDVDCYDAIEVSGDGVAGKIKHQALAAIVSRVQR